MTIQGIASQALREATVKVAAAAEEVRYGDSVSWSEEAVRLLQATHEHRTAIELARTADEIAQSAIDLIA